MNMKKKYLEPETVLLSVVTEGALICTSDYSTSSTNLSVRNEDDDDFWAY